METTLLELDIHPMQLVIDQLNIADRLRLSCTCQRMRQLCRQAVSTIRLTQEDLEEWGEVALATYTNITQLQLHEVCLDLDCAEVLTAVAPKTLQQLKRLQITNPVALVPEAAALLLQHCTNLTSWQTFGSDHAAGGSDTDFTSLQQHREHQLLRELVCQRRSGLQPAQLHAWLAAVAPDCNTRHPECHSGDDVAAHQQQPLWAARLLQSGCDDISKAAAAASGTSSCSGDSSWTSYVPAWPHLTRLDVAGCHSLGGSLAKLGWCPSLLSLSLHSCYKVSNATIEAFSRALGGEQRSLHAHRTGGCTEEASDNPAATGVTTAGPWLASTSSDLGAAEVAGRGLFAVPPLRHLDLSYTRISDAAMPHLVAALPRLAWLAVKGCNVGDDGLLHVLRLQQLTALHIKHCHRVTEEGIQQLSGLGQLRELSYGYTSMPEADDVAAAIAEQFHSLTALDLLASELTDTGLAALAKLRRLGRLRLYQAAVSSHGLEGLAGQPAGSGLSSLVLYGMGALRSLACLGEFESLQELQLGSLCDLDSSMPEALKQLTAVRHLTALTLERMDDVIVEALQDIMRRCGRLQHLRVRGCDGVSEEDMDGLARGAAEVCSSSACVWFAASASCDTDDEEEGWQMLDTRVTGT